MARISNRMAEALSAQATRELGNQVKYLQACNYFAQQNLDGMAAYCMSQADGELGHAKKFMEYITDRDGAAIIEQVDIPKSNFSNPLDVFEYIFSVEKGTTKEIERLIEIAGEENDHMSFEMLQWFIKEQVEEENTIQAIVVKLALVKQDGTGILLMNQELADLAKG